MSVGAQHATAFVDALTDRTRHADGKAACQNDAKRGRRKAEDVGAIIGLGIWVTPGNWLLRSRHR